MKLIPVQTAHARRDRFSAVIAEIQPTGVVESVCGQFRPIMLTDIPLNILIDQKRKEMKESSNLNKKNGQNEDEKTEKKNNENNDIKKE